MIKTEELSRDYIRSIIGAIANDYDGQRAIVPQFKRGMSNRTGYMNSGTDDVIGFPHGYGIDKNLIIHASWSGGLGVHKLEDDGSITNIYNNTDPSGGYGDANNQSIVLHRPSKKFVIMSYDNNGYSIWDYSPCFNNEAPSSASSLTTRVNRVSLYMNSLRGILGAFESNLNFFPLGLEGSNLNNGQ